MARKGQKDSLRALEQYEPYIRELGKERYHSGKQIFNSKTHRLQPRYSELTQVQQREVLHCGQLWGRVHGKEMRLYAQEKRLLGKIFRPDGTAIALALAASLLAATIIDGNTDGVADMVQFFVTQPARKSVK